VGDHRETCGQSWPLRRRPGLSVVRDHGAPYVHRHKHEVLGDFEASSSATVCNGVGALATQHPTLTGSMGSKFWQLRRIGGSAYCRAFMPGRALSRCDSSPNTSSLIRPAAASRIPRLKRVRKTTQKGTTMRNTLTWAAVVAIAASGQFGLRQAAPLFPWSLKSGQVIARAQLFSTSSDAIRRQSRM